MLSPPRRWSRCPAVGDAEDRPQRPDRIEFDPDKEEGYQEKWELKKTRDELEAIAYWILRDDLETIDPETGKKRGLRGDNPILFEEHIYQRRRREILNKNGIPDSSIVQGMYWKPHPDGRKVNSGQQRSRGSGFYR